jgi:hypothetical protein
MVTMKQKGLGGKFGDATGADKLAASGFINMEKSNMLGNPLMSRPEVQAVAKVTPANTVARKR